MKILFITIENINDFKGRSIYLDLINKFIEKGHYVTVVSACEKRDRKENTKVYVEIGDSGEIYKVFIDNVTKVSNYIFKGISVLTLLRKYDRVVKKALKKRTYDLVVYNSPPITISRAVKSAKKKGAFSYLLLKDIWPYDCLFGDALSLHGWKGFAFKILALLARRLYDVSDVIGCMSPANVNYLISNEPYLSNKKVEVNPNSIEPYDLFITDNDKKIIRTKYGIPVDKTIFIYGGNLGVPQGIDFALKSIYKAKFINDAFFVFVGGGTEKEKIIEYKHNENLSNLCILDTMSKNDYESLVYACDVGLIYLNNECLSPNFPSRLLSYMQASLPVICATDVYTDIGRIAEANGFGLWCESCDEDKFVRIIEKIMSPEIRKKMGLKSRCFLENNYTVEQSYNLIMRHLNNS